MIEFSCGTFIFTSRNAVWETINLTVGQSLIPVTASSRSRGFEYAYCRYFVLNERSSEQSLYASCAQNSQKCGSHLTFLGVWIVHGCEAPPHET